MSRIALLFSALFLWSPALAKPVASDGHATSTAFTKRIQSVNLPGFARRDRARALALFHGAPVVRSTVGSFPVQNAAVDYIATVSVGFPTTSYQLLIDSGSANTWIGAGTAYTPTSYSVNTGAKFTTNYSIGSANGVEYTDRVALSEALLIFNQSIGVATHTSGFQGIDGVLGIGPVGLTQGTLSPGGKIPTVTDNLFSSGVIAANLVAVSFEPTSAPSNTNGELTFGGTDASKFSGSITYAPITSASPSSELWGIDASVSYNGQTLLSGGGIIDTGTTLVLIATNAYNAYVAATGAVLDTATGLLRISSAQYAALQPLDIIVGGTTFVLSPNAQIWPRTLNTLIGGQSTEIYLVIGNSGPNFAFVLGQTFIERFYIVFDTGNRRVGIASTQFTFATTN